MLLCIFLSLLGKHAHTCRPTCMYHIFMDLLACRYAAGKNIKVNLSKEWNVKINFFFSWTTVAVKVH